MSDYFAIKALSNSLLGILKDRPAKFKAIWDGQLAWEETDAMRLGSGAHMIALEPDRFATEYAILEGPINESTQAPYGTSTKTFERWLAEVKKTEDRKILTKREYEQCKAIAEAFHAHDKIQELMQTSGKIFEQFWTTKWVDGEDEIVVKFKPDCVCLDAGVVIDLKTTVDPSPDAFGYKAGELGYYRQAAIYSQGLEAYYGKPFEFLIGAVCKEPPYEVAVYRLRPDDLKKGFDEFKALMVQYRTMRDAGVFRSYWQDDVQELDCKLWRKKR
jgi:hypothetical protein